MKTFLVGGAVRDSLLGLPVKERDWLVTDTSAEELLHRGFQRVGRHFSVFLHPETHEEYALPRGADDTLPDREVSVEEDLQRRDLTINAMAMDSQQRLVDPLNGRQDLENRILRHTPAFRDDPIRVLRLARFAARYHALGFAIAPETRALVQGMVSDGELDRLVPERVFAELAKAMSEEQPQVFVSTLRELDALAVVLPEVDCLFGIPQPPKYHPEIDTGTHTLMVLQQAARLSPLPEVRFAALVHDVGKCSTPPDKWPRHVAHEKRGVAIIQSIANRLRLPNAWRDLAVAVSRYHLHCHRAFELRPETLLKTLNALDAFRRMQRFEQFLIACEADMRGRRGFESSPYPQREFMHGTLLAAQQIDMRGLNSNTSQGKSIAETIARARVEAITAYKRNWAARQA